MVFSRGAGKKGLTRLQRNVYEAPKGLSYPVWEYKVIDNKISNTNQKVNKEVYDKRFDKIDWGRTPTGLFDMVAERWADNVVRDNKKRLWTPRGG